jgi:hypothetical protein
MFGVLKIIYYIVGIIIQRNDLDIPTNIGKRKSINAWSFEKFSVYCVCKV